MTTINRSLRVLVTANTGWSARGLACFLEAMAPRAEVKTATEIGKLDEIVAQGWPDLLVVGAPTRNPAHEELLRRVHGRYRKLPLLLITGDHQPALARRAMALGVNGYIYTETEPAEVQLALQTTAAGEYHFAEAIDNEEGAHDGAPHTVPGDIHERLTKLTRRERQVMALLGRGYANREIAERLDLREGTVRIYVHRVIRQLGLRNRVDVALCANYVATTD